MLGAGSAQHPLQPLEIFQRTALALSASQRGLGWESRAGGAVQGLTKPGVSAGVPHTQESPQLCGEQAKASCSAGEAADEDRKLREVAEPCDCMAGHCP